jgi:hypothetical protein
MRFSADMCRAGIIALATVLTCSGAQAAEEPDATIFFRGGSVGVVAGVNWGSGTLHFQGKSYPLKVSGLSVAAVGVKKFDARGNVYHLKQAADIEGDYSAVTGSLTVGVGKGGIEMKNDKGVVIKATGTSGGASLGVGPSGMTIKLKQ